MIQLTLLAAASAVVFFGWGGLKNASRWFRHPFSSSARQEQRLKDEGVLKVDGTITADVEFDSELNALTKELNSIEKESGAELDAIDAIQ